MVLNEGFFATAGLVIRSRSRPRLRLPLKDRSLCLMDSRMWLSFRRSRISLASFTLSSASQRFSSLALARLPVRISQIAAVLPTTPENPNTPTIMAVHFIPFCPCWCAVTAPRTIAVVKAMSEMLKTPISTQKSMRCCLRNFLCGLGML